MFWGCGLELKTRYLSYYPMAALEFELLQLSALLQKFEALIYSVMNRLLLKRTTILTLTSVPGSPLLRCSSEGSREGMSNVRLSHVRATSNLLRRFTIYDLASTGAQVEDLNTCLRSSSFMMPGKVIFMHLKLTSKLF